MTEDPTAGWDLTDVTCVGAGAEAWHGDVAAGTVQR